MVFVGVGVGVAVVVESPLTSKRGSAERRELFDGFSDAAQNDVEEVGPTSGRGALVPSGALCELGRDPGVGQGACSAPLGTDAVPPPALAEAVCRRFKCPLPSCPPFCKAEGIGSFSSSPAPPACGAAESAFW